MTVEENVLDLSDDPSVNLDSLIDTIILDEAISSLSPVQQAVLAMDVAGFRQWEISAVLGISRTTVWSKKTAAMQSLRTGLVS